MWRVLAGKWLPRLLLALAILSTAGCIGGSRNVSAPIASVLGVGKPAPDFTLKSLDGSTVRLSELRGKPVLVNFWATWCPPCKEEMPILEKVYQKYRDRGVVFLGVDLKEDESTVRDYVEKGKYSWTFLLDSSGEVSNSYLVTGLPETFFIDSSGIIRDVQIGAIGQAALETKLAKIL